MALAARCRRRHLAFVALRQQLAAWDFVEADTPLLVAGPGLEPHIDPLVVDVHLDLHQQTRVSRYLITSPEFALKRLVASGVERVFQLGHVFRDGERSSRHDVEFTMLEWYRGPGTLPAILDDTAALIRAVAAAIGNVSDIDVDAPPLEETITAAFQRAADVDLDPVLHQSFDGSLDGGLDGALAQALKAAGHALPADDYGFDDAFFWAMDTLVEPSLPKGRLVALKRWPARMAVLARLDDDPRYARRFEVYAHGAAGCLELCNAFDELTDPAEQRRRFESDNALRRRLGKAALPLDEAFLAALASMPPSAGNALGVDRLLMLLTGATRIDDVLGLRAD